MHLIGLPSFHIQEKKKMLLTSAENAVKNLN